MADPSSPPFSATLSPSKPSPAPVAALQSQDGGTPKRYPSSVLSTASSAPTSPVLKGHQALFEYKDEREIYHDDNKFWRESTTADSIPSLSLSTASLDRSQGGEGSSPIKHKRSYSGSISGKVPPFSMTAVESPKTAEKPPLLTGEDAMEANLEDEEDEEVDHETLHLNAELQALYTSLQRCMDLRDKYLDLSQQCLPQNPFNYDSDPLPEEFYDEVNPKPAKPWKIYPAPPPAHWTGEEQNMSTEEIRERERKRREFVWDEAVKDCVLGNEGGCKDEERDYEIDENGVYQVYSTKDTSRKPIYSVPTIKSYFQDLDAILSVISDGPVKSFAWRRLRYLESKWSMYALLNEYREIGEMKRVPHRDFYNVRKVDTHVHHSSSMNQKHMLRFIKSKMKRSPDDVVIFRDGQYLTLAQVFASLNLTAYDLSIDTLNMHAHQDSFHRFDKFNLKYNPIGESRLREIFMKTDNYLAGRYLAEITQEVFQDLEASKYQMAEYRISIYGRNLNEWDKLAKWVVNNKLFSDNVRWLIQVPRLYDVFKKSGIMKTFEEVIKNVFQPLFEVTKDPTSHPELHIFLHRVIGFDSVDDESKVERRLYRKFPLPNRWDTEQNPPYAYWIYYLYSNMTSLNQFRKARGFNTFLLRPHAGEAGDTDHLASAFLTSHSISHGILLRKVPALQYLFYLKQIGIAMSPLSNNALFLTYERNPLPDFFKRGLNVSLSTDDPLQFHFTKEPLLEEYSVAAQIYKFSPADMCELARNSCLQSGFEMEVKRHWLGPEWFKEGVDGNLIEKTNVPSQRIEYRHSTLTEERDMISRFSQPKPKEATQDQAPRGILSAAGGSHDDTLAAAAMSKGPVSLPHAKDT